MSYPRIEFTEYFPEPLAEDVIDDYENMGIKPPKATWNYRRVYPRLGDIDYPREIPGEKEHCEIVFLTGDFIQVLGSYDAIALLIEDRERLYDDEEEETD